LLLALVLLPAALASCNLKWLVELMFPRPQHPTEYAWDDTIADDGAPWVAEMDAGEADFEVDEKGTILEYVGRRDRAVAIPAQIGSTPVTAIGEWVFYNGGLTGVAMPAGLTSIGDKAFSENKLTAVAIPDSVTSIGMVAFSDNRLASIAIPDGVVFIGGGAFQSNVLASATLPTGLASINRNTFAYNRLSSITIPEGVTSIGDYAFASNYLTGIAIPGSITSIGKGAFAENRERSYTPDNMVVYGKNLLTTITIGANVKLAGGREPSFDDGFDDFYGNNGKKAGTYTLSGGRWVMFEV
jgi:hypothetical protein